ncbi:MAG: prenyltransferase/squalene oxidase repeat-containing protein [Planctomycetaceae bacterium]
MLQVARLSPKALGDAAPLVAGYVHSLATDDGGFANRGSNSDLYYTSFATSALVALQEPLPVEGLCRYLQQFGAGEQLDLVHRSCLARVWSLLPRSSRPPLDIDGVLADVEQMRTPDGGYSAISKAKRGTLYGCFLALGVYQDLETLVPNPEGIIDCIDSLKTPDGGYANSDDLPVGLTPTSSAAAALLRQLGSPADSRLAEWLASRFHPQGGFLATPDAPMPDLLSTATALHALSSLHVNLAAFREPCLDFVDTLWTARGGFYGTWEDDHLDCEYTFYGLLALGHLSV